MAYDFVDRWNFPHCLGAMDGKHCLIDPLLKSGSYIIIIKTDLVLFYLLSLMLNIDLFILMSVQMAECLIKECGTKILSRTS